MKEFTRSLIKAIIVMIGLSLLFEQQVLLILCVWILLVLLMALFWQFYALRRLAFQRQLSATHVFPGTPVTMQTHIINRKILPLSRVDMFDFFPAEVAVQDMLLIPSGRPGKKFLRRSVSLGWYQILHQSYNLEVNQRGFYKWEQVEVNTGDPFGFFLTEGVLKAPEHLVVYPKLLDHAQIPPKLRNMFGIQSARHSLYTDPVQTIGVREYQSGDPFKTIHWPASARQGTLQTRVTQPTTDLQWMCFLDIKTFPQVWMGVQPERAEWLISLTATVCTQLLKQRYKVGLASNAAAVGQSVARVAPSSHPEQGRRILECLAQVSVYASVDLPKLILRSRQQLVNGTTLVVISALIDPVLVAMMSDLARHGFPVIWVHTCPEAPNVSGIHQIYVPEVT